MVCLQERTSLNDEFFVGWHAPAGSILIYNDESNVPSNAICLQKQNTFFGHAGMNSEGVYSLLQSSTSTNNPASFLEFLFSIKTSMIQTKRRVSSVNSV
jgi:hypothetical protein